MTYLERRLARCCAIAIVAMLPVAGLVVTEGPAGAVSTTLPYNCQMLSLVRVFTAVIDTDAPATMAPGQQSAITVTSAVTIPSDVVDAIRAVGVTSVDGVSTAHGTVDGVDRTATLTIPMTPVPTTPGSTMTVVGTGPGGMI